jgi:mRNA interferase RelE/StbE
MTKGERYQIEVDRDVLRVLRRLPRDLAARIDKAIQLLADEPRPAGCKRLVGREDLFRIRVGDWRIIYTIKDDLLVVLVLELGARGGVYRQR